MGQWNRGSLHTPSCDLDALRVSHGPTFNARLAQSVERKALNLVVVGSSPTVTDRVSSQEFKLRSPPKIKITVSAQN